MKTTIGMRAVSCTALTAALLAAAGCSTTVYEGSAASDAKVQTDMSTASGSYRGSGSREVKYTLGNSGATTTAATTTKPAPAPKVEPKPTTVATKPVESKPVEARPVESKPAARVDAAAVAPASSGPSNAASMYFPTGDARSSALMVTQSMPREVRQGQEFTYDIEVKNLTNSTLQNVMVNAGAFNNLNVKGANPMWNKTADGGMWNIGDLGPGQSKKITVTATANGTGQAGNCLTASYNNSLCAMTNVTQPALAINKAVTPAEGTPCDTYTYTIEVKNTGSGTADAVRIKDALPAGTTLANGGQSIDDLIGNLGAGQSARRSYQVKSAKSGTYTNKAQAVAEGGLAVDSNTVTHVVRQPQLAISIECPKNQLMGRNLRYNITVRNTGDGTCSNATLAAGVTSGGGAFSNISDGGQASSSGGVTWNLGSMAPGASKTVSAVVRPSAGGVVNVAATASCPCSTDAKADCNTTIQGVPDIGTGIEDFTGVRQVGENHTYSYIVKNQGQVDLTNVTMVASFDPGLEYVSTTWTGGAQAAGGKVTWKIGTLKVGEQRKFDFVAKGAKEGQLIVRTETTSDQTSMVRNDEQVNYVTAE